MARLKRGKEIFNAMKYVLQKNMLQESTLFRRVNDRLRESRGKGILVWDFTRVAKLSVEEGRLGRKEDKQSRAKVKPVYYFLTESYLKKYQRYDFVEIDQEKDRQRMLFQLLILYEINVGRIIRIGDRGHPGFTPQEILRHAEKQLASYGNIPWFHPSCIFTHMKFEIKEIEEAVSTLEKNRSIEQFSLTKERYSGHGQLPEIRYRISDKLRGLMQLVWSLYQEKLGILANKYLVGTFNDDDETLLLYLHRRRNTEKLMQEWKDTSRDRYINEEAIEMKDGRLVLAKSIQIRETEFKVKVDKLLERYLPLLNEYGLPESFIRTILS